MPFSRPPHRMLALTLLVAPALVPARAQTNPLLAHLMRAADEFQQKAPRLTTTETLHQISFSRPPHSIIAVGAAAADVLTPRFLSHEIVSEYSFGHLKGSPPTALVEFRELLSMDGRPIQTPAVAQRALSTDVRSGEDRVRKHILEEFTKLGLVDVATDYGAILLAFTTRGVQDLRITQDIDCFVGTEEAVRFNWVQATGGALEFRGRKAAHRPLEGAIWLRKSDGVPLRISATFAHEERRHALRDDASVDYVVSSLGFPLPVTVVHRHYIDGQPLTENLYTYEPFHLFTTDTNIRYTGVPTSQPPK